MKNQFTPALAFLFAFFTLLTTNLSATTYTFTNGGGNNLWSNASNWSPSGIPGAGDDVSISNKDITIDLDITVNSISINGNAVATFTHSNLASIGTLTLSGGELISTNEIEITTGFHWDGNSKLTNSATVTLKTGSINTISGSSNRNLYAALVNEGTLSHSGGSIRFQTGGSILNEGTFSTDGSAMIINTGGDKFTNAGTFNKTGSASLGFFAILDQTATGILNITGGTLSLLYGGDYTSGAKVSISSGASLNLSSGTFNLNSGTSIEGTGTLETSGGTSNIESTFAFSGTTVVSGGTTEFNGTSPYNFETLTLSGGTIQGSAPLDINTKFNWTSSAILKSTDTLSIAASATGLIYSGGTKQLHTPIINEGLISHTGGNLRYYTGGSITNNGTFTMNGPTSVYDNGGEGMINQGLFDYQKTAVLNFYAPFNNTSSGTIKGKATFNFSSLTNNGSFFADADYGTLNITGDYNNGKDLTIEFDGSKHGDLQASGDINLSGALNIDYSGSVADGTYTILSTSSGTVNGKFDTENVPANLSVSYSSNSVELVTAALPVELSSFRLNVQAKDILLHWQTVSELNSDRFIIEHSNDGRNYTEIGYEAAAGFSNRPINYIFSHNQPTNGENYYRLKQVDLDGTFEYSDIRVASFYNFKKEVSVFPNPTQGAVIIKNQGEKDFSLQIIHLSGKVVYQQHNITPGATMIDLSGLSKGMYTIRFFDEVYSQEEKIMILE